MLLPVLAALLAASLAPDIEAPPPGTIYVGPAVFCLNHETAQGIAAAERSGRSGQDLFERDATCGAGTVQVRLLDKLDDFRDACRTRYWYWRARSITDGSSTLYVLISIVEPGRHEPAPCARSAPSGN